MVAFELKGNNLLVSNIKKQINKRFENEFNNVPNNAVSGATAIQKIPILTCHKLNRSYSKSLAALNGSKQLDMQALFSGNNNYMNDKKTYDCSDETSLATSRTSGTSETAESSVEFSLAALNILEKPEIPPQLTVTQKEYRTIPQTAFVEEFTCTEDDVCAIVHIYVADNDKSAVLDYHLSKLANQLSNSSKCQFVRMEGKFAPYITRKLGILHFPAVIALKDNTVVSQLCPDEGLDIAAVWDPTYLHRWLLRSSCFSDLNEDKISGLIKLTLSHMEQEEEDEYDESTTADDSAVGNSEYTASVTEEYDCDVGSYGFIEYPDSDSESSRCFYLSMNTCSY